jgi:hypothetical protein
MAVRRTRSQKEHAALRRMQVQMPDQNGNETITYRLPSASTGKHSGQLAEQVSKTVAASSKTSVTTPFNMTSVFPYDIQLVYQDLLRTIVVTGIVFAGLAALWHFRIV